MAKKEVFKSSLDVPWNDWPSTVLGSEKMDPLWEAVDKDTPSSCNLNEISVNLSNKKYNCTFVVDSGQAQPFFLHHLPGLAYSTQSFLVLLDIESMNRLVQLCGKSETCRVIGLRIDSEKAKGLGLSPLTLQPAETSHMNLGLTKSNHGKKENKV